jgi:hypothetical protein
VQYENWAHFPTLVLAEWSRLDFFCASQVYEKMLTELQGCVHPHPSLVTVVKLFQYSLVDSLEELPLVFPDFGMVNLL